MKIANAMRSGSARHDWLRRLGLAGTLFFLVKGLLWILVPALLAWLGAGRM